MKTTATAVRYFIAVNADTRNQVTIDGIGHSEAASIADAVLNSGVGQNYIFERDRTARDEDGDLIEVHFVAEECTKALYDLVEENGGARLSWGRNADGLQDIVVE